MLKEAGSVFAVSARHNSGSFPSMRNVASITRVIAAVVDEVEIAIGQFAVNEFHVGIVAAFGIIEIRLQVERIENVRQVQTGVNTTSAYLVNTAAITEQL